MIFSEVDDLRIVHNDLSGCDALSLFGIVRNELYYLPAFLDHYRRLGVVRFVILDDQSDDGSREFLTAQPDVMLLGSARRYGERVFPDQVDTQLADVRMVHAWRTLMLKRYSLGRWALLVDADEFLRLPPGVSLGRILAHADAAGRRAILCAMLDVYPRSLADVEHEASFDPSAEWYFDGEPHLRMRGAGRPQHLHGGTRARLYATHVRREGPLRRLVRRLRGRPAFPMRGFNFKVAALKVQPRDTFFSSHWPGVPVVEDVLLPLLHYKFTPDLFRRIVHALETRGYASGSVLYDELESTLGRMARTSGSLLYRHSRQIDDFAAFLETGNASLPHDLTGKAAGQIEHGAGAVVASAAR